MPELDDYITTNLASWDARSAAHARSRTYDVERFVADPAHLSGVVQFDRARLPELGGLQCVHLQCHIGTDTISLARLGARMTGVDFSSAALTEARRLADRCHTAVDFIESDVYRVLDVLEPGSFDLVYTGIGALCWLPDIARWAAVVTSLLRPGGRLFLREGHPMLWSIDDRHSDRLVVDHSYFERPEPMVMYEGGSYVETDVDFPPMATHEWNHGLGEIVSALLECGMELTSLVEHDSLPWKGIRGEGRMVCDEYGEWRLAERPWRLAASYTLQARRPPLPSAAAEADRQP